MITRDPLRRPPRRMPILIAVGALTLACSELGPNGEIPLTVELETDRLELIAGLIGPGPVRDPNVYVRVTVRRNGYAGPIDVRAEAPAQLSATVIPTGSDPAVDVVTWIGVAAPAGTIAGDYPIRVRAVAGTRGSATSTLTVTVLPFVMTVYQPELRVNRGGSNTLSVVFTKAGASSVPVSVSNVPDGLNVAVTPAGDRTYLDVSAASDAPLGAHSFAVSASASGLTVSRQLSLVVQAVPPKRPVAFRLCRAQALGATGRPTYAYANEGEGWVQVAPDADDLIRFDATERVSVAEFFYAVVNYYQGGPFTRVVHTTAAELERMQCASSTAGTRTYPVTASGAAVWDARLGAFRSFRTGASSGSIGGTRPGPHDLVATGERDGSGPKRVAIVRRAVDLPDRDPITLDFSGSEAVVLDSARITVQGTQLPAEASVTLTHAHTSTTIAPLATSTATDGWYWTLPAAALATSDVQSIMVRRNEAATARGLVHYLRTAQDVTAALGPGPSAATVDVATQTITVPSQPEYPDLAGAGYLQVLDNRGLHHQVEVWQTKSFVGSTPANWTFHPPDLGRVTGVPPISSQHITVAAAGGPAPLFFGATPAPGTTLRWTMLAGGRFGQSLPFPAGR